MIAEARVEVIRRELWHRRERARRMRARDLLLRLDGLQQALEAAHLRDEVGMTTALDAAARERFGQAAAFLGLERPPVAAVIRDVMETLFEFQQELMSVMNERRRWRPPPEEET